MRHFRPLLRSKPSALSRAATRAVAATFLSLLVTASTNADDSSPHLEVGPLLLQIPSDWHWTGSVQHGEGHDAHGEKFSAAYSALSPLASDQASARVLLLARSFAKDKMAALAAKQGHVIRSVQERPLADSRTEFSTISQGRKRFRDHYFLQYLLVSRRGMVYFTAEGYGNAVQSAIALEQVLATQTWTDESTATAPSGAP